ncbi:MAG TPA: metallopeptidase TldD-related protein, partial [Phycisphaerae bacterium]
MKNRMSVACLFPAFAWVPIAVLASDPGKSGQPPMIVALLDDELRYSMEHLTGPDGTKPYYLAYTIAENERVTLSAGYGALESDDSNRSRQLDIDLRVGDYKLDNTHQIRDGGRSGPAGGAGSTRITIEDNPDSIRHDVWLATDEAFKAALTRYARVQTDVKVKVEEEDKSADFSREEPNTYYEPRLPLALERDARRGQLKRVSAMARDFPLVYSATVALADEVNGRYMVTSEGTRLQTSSKRCRVFLQASTKAEDGMDLSQTRIFDAASEERLPDEAALASAMQQVIDQVLALRAAPLVQPYTGPAILRNRASGVFFHEIFGHRIEGHRQKDVTEGQTFTKKINQEVLPTFLSVYDDPTQAQQGAIDLAGYYRFDDEGVAARRVPIIQDGVLKTFLLSRSPVAGFTASNGHGRRQPGLPAVSRQGNLIVESAKSVNFDELRNILVQECQRQGKPYGLLFEDITGGFTTTRTSGPQAFKVLPIIVYRVYVDGRPDELVRGVDIVGTPLSCFEKIIATGNDVDVFNGVCGAESGWVPVSAVSPSILVSQIEIEKRERSQS